MSRTVVHRIGHRGRIAGVVSACALVAAGAVALIGSATSHAASSGAGLYGCSDATLNGTYADSGISWSSGSSPTATSFADFTTFDGRGDGAGTATVVSNGAVELGPFASDTSTYIINRNCTGTLSVSLGGTVIGQFDLFVSPSGDSYGEVETYPADSEFAVTDKLISR